jgi:hypothetical protein
MNQPTATSDLNALNDHVDLADDHVDLAASFSPLLDDHIDGLAASLPPLPGLGLLQTQEFVVTETLAGVEAAHIGTRHNAQAICTDTIADLQVNSNATQVDCQANIHNNDAPSTCAIQHQPLNKNSSVKSKRKRIHFANKCIRAKKSFFLASSTDLIYDEIGNDVLLNGKILSVPSKGTEVYKFFWDTSTLTIPVDESKLRVTVHRAEKDNVNALKRARILFDEEYPNGAPPGVLSINSTQLRKMSSANTRNQQ